MVGLPLATTIERLLTLYIAAGRTNAAVSAVPPTRFELVLQA